VKTVAANTKPVPVPTVTNSAVVQKQTQAIGKAIVKDTAAMLQKKPCPFGDHCHQEGCDKYHTTKACAHGSECKYIGTCFFYHRGVSHTAKGKSLFSRVEKLTPKLESLNGKQQFKPAKAIGTTLAAFNAPQPVHENFDSHGVFINGKVIMTKHGFVGMDEVWFKFGGNTFKVDKAKFEESKTALDIVFAPAPHPWVSTGVKMREPTPSEKDVNVVVVFPELAIGSGLCISQSGREMLYNSPTENGNSGCGVWGQDGKLIGFHRSGGNGRPNGFVPITKEFISEINGQHNTPKNE
jgi:hypothetical protein